MFVRRRITSWRSVVSSHSSEFWHALFNVLIFSERMSVVKDRVVPVPSANLPERRVTKTENMGNNVNNSRPTPAV